MDAILPEDLDALTADKRGWIDALYALDRHKNDRVMVQKNVPLMEYAPGAAAAAPAGHFKVQNGLRVALDGVRHPLLVSEGPPPTIFYAWNRRPPLPERLVVFESDILFRFTLKRGGANRLALDRGTGALFVDGRGYCTLDDLGIAHSLQEYSHTIHVLTGPTTVQVPLFFPFTRLKGHMECRAYKEQQRYRILNEKTQPE